MMMSTSWIRSTAVSAWSCRNRLLSGAAAALIVAAACSDSGGSKDAGSKDAQADGKIPKDLGPDAPPLEPVFPEDFAKTYTQGRTCRRSIDHDLRWIVVMVDDAAIEPYTLRNGPFPVGATLVKMEHETDDKDCSKPPVSYTAMQKLEAGANPGGGDWHWQRVTITGQVLEGFDTIQRCTMCHEKCGVPTDGGPLTGGYEWTCAELP